MPAACLMLVMASGLGVFQIIPRFVAEQPAEWSEALIRLGLIWMICMGIPAAFRQGAMVSVDVRYRWSPPKIKRDRGGEPGLHRTTTKRTAFADRGQGWGLAVPCTSWNALPPEFSDRVRPPR